MPLTVEDIPGLFLQKGANLKKLLAANDYADLKALSKSGVNLLEAANLAPDRPSGEIFEYVKTRREFVAIPGSERFFRAGNLMRIAIAAVACALEAGALDAVAWAIGLDGFGPMQKALECYTWWNFSAGIPIQRVLSHDGSKLARRLSLEIYIKLVDTRLLDRNALLLVDLLTRRPDEATEIVNLAHALSIDLEKRLARVSPIVYRRAHAAFYWATRPDAEPEDFVRHCVEHEIQNELSCRLQESAWASEFVSEFVYWQIVQTALPLSPRDQDDTLRKRVREKLGIHPKNAGVQ